jgi:hypothetical protein
MLNYTSVYRDIRSEASKMSPDQKKYTCSVCGKEISQQENEDYDGKCWECWDDQLTEESDSMFDELM